MCALVVGFWGFGREARCFGIYFYDGDKLQIVWLRSVEDRVYVLDRSFHGRCLVGARERLIERLIMAIKIFFCFHFPAKDSNENTNFLAQYLFILIFNTSWVLLSVQHYHYLYSSKCLIINIQHYQPQEGSALPFFPFISDS